MSRGALLIPLILFLSACSGGGNVVPRYDPPHKPGGRLCAVQCRNAFDHCADGCGLQERVCMNQMQAQAIKDYEAYAQEQFKARAEMTLRPSDFESPEKCAASSCRAACETTYNACFEQCGGKIVK